MNTDERRADQASRFCDSPGNSTFRTQRPRTPGRTMRAAVYHAWHDLAAVSEYTYANDVEALRRHL
jgi:hypothetical protein